MTDKELIALAKEIQRRQRLETEAWRELADMVNGWHGPNHPKGAPQAPARPHLRVVGSERRAA